MDAIRVSRDITDLLTRLSRGPAPRVRAWDGTEWGNESSAATLVLNHPGALRSMFIPPNDLAAGEAYVFEDIDIEGDIYSMLEFGVGLEGLEPSLTTVKVARMLRRLPNSPAMAGERPRRRPIVEGRLHSIVRDRQAVAAHYDTGNDFFRLFLDPNMVYSSAAFLDPGEPLEVAQRRKLDLVCRKLGLEEGDRLLDVGCGWGALVVHAASEYGVHATGITVSREQAAHARHAAKDAGVDERVEILEQDYRMATGEFDAIASVGMFEHVGRNKLTEYFRHLRGLLAPGGQLLNHGIVTHDRGRISRKPSFVRTYVFPDGDLRPLDEVIGAAEDSGFELRDAEALRPSYALTLRRWVENLETNRWEAVSLAGEQVYRIWRAYMAGSAIAFERQAIGVYQLLLTDATAPTRLGRSHLLASDDSASMRR